MLYQIVNDFPNEIFEEKSDGPFVSIYQPTHRKSSENKQDVIRYKNLVKEIEESLKQRYPRREISSILNTLHELAQDSEFWLHSYDGVAVFMVENKCIIYKLQRKVEELALVSDRFYIKPLIRYFQSADRYQLLGLNRKEFRLYEGNRYILDEIELPSDIPRTIEEALGDEYTESYLKAASYGGNGRAMFHGHGSRKDEIEVDMERFFRVVDRVVYEFSKSSKLPLMLVALPEYHTPFKKLSNNPYLMEEGIRVDFDSISLEKLKERAWKQMEIVYLNKTKEVVDRFENARAKFNGTDDLGQMVRAALENRVDTMLVEADRVIPGKINTETMQIEEGEISDPQVGDVLDDLAEIVLKNNGEVIVLPRERMPSTTGGAAIYRF